MTTKPPSGKETMSPHILQASRYHWWIYQHFRKWINGHALEIGAGHGLYTQFLNADAASVTATDIDAETISLIQSHLSASNISFQQLDMTDARSCQALPRKYETIVCLNVLEHIEDDDEAVRHLAELLAPGGHVVLVVPAFQWLFTRLDSYAGHFRRYTKTTLCGLLREAGVEVVHTIYFNAIGIPGWLLFGKIMRPKSLADPGVNGAIYLFDRLMTTISTVIDHAIFHAVGLSLLVVARKPSETS